MQHGKNGLDAASSTHSCAYSCSWCLSPNREIGWHLAPSVRILRFAPTDASSLMTSVSLQLPLHLGPSHRYLRRLQTPGQTNTDGWARGRLLWLWALHRLLGCRKPISESRVAQMSKYEELGAACHGNQGGGPSCRCPRICFAPRSRGFKPGSMAPQAVCSAANLAAARATATDEQLGVGRACASCNRCPESQALEAPNKSDHCASF